MTVADDLHPLYFTELFEDWSLDRLPPKIGVPIFFIGLFPITLISIFVCTIPSFVVTIWKATH